MKTIKEISNLTGVTVRTLQYYDKIDLLKPSNHTISGYRQYDSEALIKLQQILLYKELGFSLKEIKLLLNDPTSDYQTNLSRQRTLLMHKKEGLESMITLIDSILKGEKDMDFEVFKKALANKMPSEVKDKEQIANQLSFTNYSSIKEVWGEKEFLDLPSLSKDEFDKFMEQNDILLKELALENDEVKQMHIISHWIKLHEKTFNIRNPKAFAKITSDLYGSDKNVINQVNSKFGTNFNRILSNLLAKF
ncbi:MerR family transcriptional regulator [Lysinibacillus sp. NPDC097231]|uniref:MerR family transcriptional regulator n=1 Tax=Lysinibacillus sp. NPDC097231 TaxID=3364142 RepID=UPI00382369BB